MNQILLKWISESESWKSFIDFQIPADAMADYPFLHNKDDFFISLMGIGIDTLKKYKGSLIQDEALAIAKGLELFSLKGKKEHFLGINESNNLLYAAGFYYLCDFTASSIILSRISNLNSYKNKIDRFIANFLQRNLSHTNEYSAHINNYLQNGDNKELEILDSELEQELKFTEEYNTNEYSEYLLAIALLYKFRENNIWDDLISIKNDIDFWRPYVRLCISMKPAIWTFFPSQRDALQKGILSEETFSLQMPTSSGKSFISEIVIYNEIKSNPGAKILYLAPFRSLAAELKQTLARRLTALGITSRTIYGGSLPTIEERNNIIDVDLIIATPEKYNAIENIYPDLFEMFTTVICDEGHLLDDSSRGLEYELLLTKLKKSNRKIKFLFISAIIPNIEQINNWLGGDENTVVKSDFRPTNLEYAFLKKMTTGRNAYLLDVNPTLNRPDNYQLYRFLDQNELVLTHRENGSKYRITSRRAISVAVALKASKAGSVALFSPVKRGSYGIEGLAEELIKQITYKGTDGLITEATYDSIFDAKIYFRIIFGDEYLLTKAIECGFVYHHGDFPQFIREIIENLIKTNIVKIFICTNTLAEGVNLPIRTLIIHSTHRFDPNVTSKYSKLLSRDLKNLVGRSGRAGKETKGFIITPHEDDFENVISLINETDINPVRGQLYNLIRPLAKELLELRVPITAEIVDSFSGPFRRLIDSIDICLIDLLSEEVTADNLVLLVNELVSSTFSYVQSTDKERETLERIFIVRSQKLIPFFENNEFHFIKNSGASINLYGEIIEHFNFEIDHWIIEDNDVIINTIIKNGLLKLESLKYELIQFNKTNKTSYTDDDVITILGLWIQGKWFQEIADSAHSEIHQVMRLINGFLTYNLQISFSTTIRIAELKNKENALSNIIIDFPAFIQYGLDSELKLSILELGLVDREAILRLSSELLARDYSYEDLNKLRTYLIESKDLLQKLIELQVNNISLRNIADFIRKL